MKLYKIIIVSFITLGLYNCNYVYIPTAISETESAPFDHINDPIIINSNVYGYPDTRFGFGFKTNIAQQRDYLGIKMNVFNWETGSFVYSQIYKEAGIDYLHDLGLFCKVTGAYYASWRGKILSFNPSTGNISVDYNTKLPIRLYLNTITDDGYGLLTDFLVHNRDGKTYSWYYIYNFKDKKLTEKPLEFEDGNSGSAQINRLIKDSNNKLWFRCNTNDKWTGYRLDPATGNLDIIFEHNIENESIHCIGTVRGKVLFSSRITEFTDDNPENLVCRLYIFNENSGELERVVEDKRFPASMIDNVFEFNDKIYLNYYIDNGGFRNNNIFEFNIDTGELTDLNKKIEFLLYGNLIIRGENLFLFNGFIGNSLVGVRVDLNTMEIVQEYNIPYEDYTN